MAITAWIYASSFPSDDAVIVSKRSSYNSGFQLDTTVDRGTRTIGFKLTTNSGTTMARYGKTTLQTNTWYHVAGVYDATARTLNVYLNGQLDNGALVGSVAGSQRNSEQPVNIGRRPGYAGFEFAGVLDNVRIYNRALRQADVEADMNGLIAAGIETAPFRLAMKYAPARLDQVAVLPTSRFEMVRPRPIPLGKP
jgi:hypothetical protein